MEYFMISAKFVPLKYYTLSSQLQRLTLFSVGCSGRRILSPGQIVVMRKWSIGSNNVFKQFEAFKIAKFQFMRTVQMLRRLPITISVILHLIPFPNSIQNQTRRYHYKRNQ